MYICGITPYDTTHLGNAFTYIFFDALFRYLKFKGHKVTYTQNVTDINDRDKDILERARQQNISWKKLADFWTKKFLKDMGDLNWIKPTNYLYASQEIAPIIRIIEKLLQKGYAYEKAGSVYFDISKFKNYGNLSGFSNTQMLKVAKGFEEDLENPDKKHPLDITLWRGTDPNQPKHIPSFLAKGQSAFGGKSPFGSGRQGWHIECSAMAINTLGNTIDIHGGGTDLIFPHHEAEIAQSESATGKVPFAKYWIHTSQVFYQGQKMSKSKGNLVLVSDLLKKHSPNAIRWMLLSHSWRKNWEFRQRDLHVAQYFVSKVKLALRDSTPNRDSTPKILEALDDNFNTPRALEILLKNPSKEAFSLLGFK